jgi:hypothetical protein
MWSGPLDLCEREREKEGPSAAAEEDDENLNDTKLRDSITELICVLLICTCKNLMSCILGLMSSNFHNEKGYGCCK